MNEKSTFCCSLEGRSRECAEELLAIAAIDDFMIFHPDSRGTQKFEFNAERQKC
jgi:hypothetical protein